MFAVLFLKRSLNRFHYLGILCCGVGICLVGTSSLMSGEGSSTHPVSTEQMLTGMGLIVASQVGAPGPVRGLVLAAEGGGLLGKHGPGVGCPGGGRRRACSS